MDKQADIMDLDDGSEDLRELLDLVKETPETKEPPQDLPKRDKAEAPKRPRGRPRTDAAQKATPKPTPKVSAGLSRNARVQGIQGMVQLGAAGCVILGKVSPAHEVAFQADAITLASSADQIAEAIADTCAADERFARVVDRVSTVGPYGALIQVMFSVGMQIARNHGAPVPGHAPEELIQMATQEA